MTSTKRILVWSSENILGSSIKLFLAAREDWVVTSMTDQEDQAALILAVESEQPDVVIIHRECFDSDPAQLMLQFLIDHPNIKVVTVSLENNAVEVISKQKILVQQASDLIAAIEAGS